MNLIFQERLFLIQNCLKLLAALVTNVRDSVICGALVKLQAASAYPILAAVALVFATNVIRPMSVAKSAALASSIKS